MPDKCIWYNRRFNETQEREMPQMFPGNFDVDGDAEAHGTNFALFSQQMY